jgi:hypothetical protein
MPTIEDQKHYDEVVAFARSVNLYEPDIVQPGDDKLYLKATLDRLERFTRKREDGELTTRVVLYRDFAKQSFGFSVQNRTPDGWVATLVGGVIFHGSHDRGGDGGSPTFSVSLTPTMGWSIHT